MTGRPRILFVDDEPNVLDALRRGLRDRRTAWDLVFESDPEAALQGARRQAPDVVVSDMAMPQMSGLHMILSMRRAVPGTSYIVLTGTADLHSAVDAINQAEIFRFFIKPCPIPRLVEGIEAALAAQRRREPAAAPDAVAQAVGAAALDRLAIGVIAAQADGHVVYMNRRGAELCLAGDGLMLDAREVCRSASLGETRRLHALIQDAAAGGEAGGGALAIGRPSMKRSLSLVVLPMADGPGDSHRGLAVIYAIDPETYPLPEPARLATVLGLSPAEARLTHALALGHDVETAAEQSGVTVSTARTYLKQIFLKTGTRRQAELVKLVLTQPAIDP